LLAVSGLTPQIITETFYALAVGAAPRERFVPTEIQAVTTTEGARRILAQLLDPQRGALAALLTEHGLPPCLFGEAQLHVARRPDGELLDDIRDDADNSAMADTISRVVQALTSDANCAVHVSLAGGRKTMGYYAGYALSLFGRDQDRLSHVLVQPPFEGLADFYYPPSHPRWITLADGRRVDAATAVIQLAAIPFLRLRQGLPRGLLDGQQSFVQAVDAAAPSLAPPGLTLHIDTHRIVADGRALALRPAEFAIYAALAHRAIHGKQAMAAPLRDQHDADWAEELLADLRAAVGLLHMPGDFAESLRHDCTAAKVSPHISRLRTKLEQHLPPSRLMHYFDDGNTPRNKRYRIPLPAAAITFVAPRSGG
jgi:CRISPR-associated protein (TIGR02584 family)